MALLEVIGVEHSFYGVQALRGVDLEVEAGRITGLIGPNGAGKTTLFNCITGVVPPDRGRIVFDGRDIAGLRPDQITARGLVRTFQIARGLPRLSVLDNLLLYGAHQPGERMLPALLRLASVRSSARRPSSPAPSPSPAGSISAPSSATRLPTCPAARRSCSRSAAR